MEIRLPLPSSGIKGVRHHRPVNLTFLTLPSVPGSALSPTLLSMQDFLKNLKKLHDFYRRSRFLPMKENRWNISLGFHFLSAFTMMSGPIHFPANDTMSPFVAD